MVSGSAKASRSCVDAVSSKRFQYFATDAAVARRTGRRAAKAAALGCIRFASGSA